jgi:hypothetical protein
MFLFGPGGQARGLGLVNERLDLGLLPGDQGFLHLFDHLDSPPEKCAARKGLSQ